MQRIRLLQPGQFIKGVDFYNQDGYTLSNSICIPMIKKSRYNTDLQRAAGGGTAVFKIILNGLIGSGGTVYT